MAGVAVRVAVGVEGNENDGAFELVAAALLAGGHVVGGAEYPVCGGHGARVSCS